MNIEILIEMAENQPYWVRYRMKDSQNIAKACLISSGCPDYQLDDASDDWRFDVISERLHIVATGGPRYSHPFWNQIDFHVD